MEWTRTSLKLFTISRFLHVTDTLTISLVTHWKNLVLHKATPAKIRFSCQQDMVFLSRIVDSSIPSLCLMVYSNLRCISLRNIVTLSCIFVYAYCIFLPPPHAFLLLVISTGASFWMSLSYLTILALAFQFLCNELFPLQGKSELAVV